MRGDVLGRAINAQYLGATPKRLLLVLYQLIATYKYLVDHLLYNNQPHIIS
jgi:hypothetical protein